MNDAQIRIMGLQEKGWTLVALAEELGVTPNAVEKWKAGDRYPANAKVMLAMLDQLTKSKRLPKRRHHTAVPRSETRVPDREATEYGESNASI